MNLIYQLKEWWRLKTYDEHYCRRCGACAYTTTWRFKQHDCKPDPCKYGSIHCQARRGRKKPFLRCSNHVIIRLKKRNGAKKLGVNTKRRLK